MKTYLAGIIPKIKRYSEKLDNLTLLTNQHWVVLDELSNSKLVYIFRSNFELLISKNGKVEKGKWEYLGNNSLLIERKDESYLFRHGFFDANILALKVDGKDEFAFLINENNYGGDLNSIEKILDFLERKYLKMIPQNQIELLNNHNKSTETELTTLNLDKDLNPVENSEWKHGYMDRQGNLIIEYKYDMAYDFSEGLASVYLIGKKTDYYGFVDEKGNEIIPLKYEFAESFSEGLCLARLNRKFGFLNKIGETIIGFKFDEAASFEFGKARVKINGRKFYIDKKGNEI
ncbi:WG repeat-containing protein [Brumimicrobium glaciale]|uniref:WG repeat-containing protein n=1 Tax=Brumimicrobium glaciale TaxID=200475 RepID=A0A4Q4KJ90_9FLAO|nr:WG repeat-containing protein [Brumimicrobium glaciale]RYM32900.1 WG repeat-containing protein [Brumimicrobium glaciale]